MENYSVKNTDLFLQAYRELETIKTDNDKMYYYFENKNKNLFDTFRSIRNNLSHNTLDGSYPVIVSKEILLKLQDLIKEMQIMAVNVCILGTNIYTAKLKSKLSKVIEIMGINNYSHVPILDHDRKVIGIVSEHAIIDILSNNAGLLYNADTIVEDYVEYFTLSDNNNECYPFIKSSAFLYEAKEKFDSRYNSKRKVGVIFITKNGEINEEIIGMLTARSVYSKI